jgi:hypothetical protein
MMGPKYKLTGNDLPEFRLRAGPEMPIAPLEGRIVEWISAKLPNIVPPDGYKIAWHLETCESEMPGYTTITVRPELREIIRIDRERERETKKRLG